ncbi:hypothetical protein J6590_016478 [Homalodisca vitripennis]|nr:hypothetical protein J6590_016478 [Homalodisca vitripennis]
MRERNLAHMPTADRRQFTIGIWTAEVSTTTADVSSSAIHDSLKYASLQRSAFNNNYGNYFHK